MRIGHGYDVHRLTQGRKLILGGVEIPFDLGLLGHSDADVLTHAVMDALLGAAGLGDIGRLFPDTDPAYAGADSLVLLDAVMERLRAAGYRVGNVDATVLAQRPKLAPHIPAMRDNLARRMGVTPDRVNVKATTPPDGGHPGPGEREGHHRGEAGLHRRGGGHGRPRSVSAGGGTIRFWRWKGGRLIAAPTDDMP